MMRQVKTVASKNISSRVFHLFSHCRYAVEPDVGEDRYRGTAKERRSGEGRGIVEGPKKIAASGLHGGEDVADALTKEENDHQTHGDRENGVHAARCLNATRVEIGREKSERDHPEPIGDAGDYVTGSLAAPDDADDGVKQIVHQHCPSDDVTEFRIEFLGDVAEGGARARVDTSHATVTDCSE